MPTQYLGPRRQKKCFYKQQFSSTHLHSKSCNKHCHSREGLGNLFKILWGKSGVKQSTLFKKTHATVSKTNHLQILFLSFCTSSFLYVWPQQCAIMSFKIPVGIYCQWTVHWHWKTKPILKIQNTAYFHLFSIKDLNITVLTCWLHLWNNERIFLQDPVKLLYISQSRQCETSECNSWLICCTACVCDLSSKGFQLEQ